MRIPAITLTLLLFAGEVRAQTPAPAPQAELQIRSLTIVTDQLPAADRLRIADSLQGIPCDPDELRERVRMKLRDLGFYYAQVETPELSKPPAPKSNPPQASEAVDVSVKVSPGAQFRFGFIEFKGESVFSSFDLRSQFPVQTGGLFNVTSVGYGLERLKRLYQEKGYINFAAVPTSNVDEARHTINLTIDIDEGKPYTFGHLILDGTEPHAGDGNALVSSWISLQGKTYNPDLLKDWLSSNCPDGLDALNRTQAIPANDPRQVNIRIQFP